MIDGLIDILGREATLFEEFLQLLEEQQRALVEKDLPALQEITEKLQEKTVKSRLLDQERQKVVAEIKASRGLDGDLNVTRLLEITDDERADQLRRLRGLILKLHDQVTEVRNRNALLINRSREYVARTMKMLSELNMPEPAYSAAGNQRSEGQALAVNRRA
jgi:hypothetical protein